MNYLIKKPFGLCFWFHLAFPNIIVNIFHSLIYLHEHMITIFCNNVTNAHEAIEQIRMKHNTYIKASHIDRKYIADQRRKGIKVSRCLIQNLYGM